MKWILAFIGFISLKIEIRKINSINELLVNRAEIILEEFTPRNGASLWLYNKTLKMIDAKIELLKGAK